MQFITDNLTYSPSSFVNEDELERAAVQHADKMFGPHTIYLDIKKRLKNQQTSFINIPDGYVLAFGRQPRLWVVEHELSSHDSFRHIGVQLLQFATQFTAGSYKLKELLAEAIKEANLSKRAHELLPLTPFSHLGDVLDYAIFKQDFGFVVVIDQINDDLIQVTRELQRQPEILRLTKYTHGTEQAYAFDTLLEEVSGAASSKVTSLQEIDTIVCPARKDGVEQAFLGEKAWWAVRISPSVLAKLKYLAIYEVQPISTINWVGVIQSIRPYEDTGKYKIYLSDIFPVGPITMGHAKYAPQAPRYTTYSLLCSAKTLADIF